VVALGDMPFLTPVTTQSVVSALNEGASLAAPFISGVRAHPVGFAQRWFKQLSTLQGDQGAREILRKHPDEFTRIISEDQGA